MDNQPPPTLLVIEDDPEIRSLLQDLLREEGFDVRAAADAQEADTLFAEMAPDLVVLDVMLPGESGLSVRRRLRSSSVVPFLMLTARGEEIDRVLGLEIGADDYLVKPFSPRELVARIRSLLRRVRMTDPTREAARQVFSFDGFTIDIDGRELKHGTQALSLTSAEFDLLAALVRNPRKVLSRDQLIDAVHGRTASPFDRTIDVLISRLRAKLDSASPGAPLISTIRGGGYLFTQPVRLV